MAQRTLLRVFLLVAVFSVLRLTLDYSLFLLLVLFKESAMGNAAREMRGEEDEVEKAKTCIKVPKDKFPNLKIDATRAASPTCVHQSATKERGEREREGEGEREQEVRVLSRRKNRRDWNVSKACAIFIVVER